MEEKMMMQALDIGEAMLKSGGEVSRVEDTITRILRAYGAVRVDVFTITSEIQVTAMDDAGETYTRLRRVYQWGTDLERLEDLNQLSRYICQYRPDSGTVQQMLTEVMSAKKNQSPSAAAYVGAILAASGFTVFFGGSAGDALATAVLACVITFMNRHSHSKSENQLLYYFLFAIVTGIIGYVLVQIGYLCHLSLNLDKMLIGCIMLTIPGIAITYSVRDMMIGETITGLLRFSESLLIAASIAGGYIFSSMVLGGVFG